VAHRTGAFQIMNLFRIMSPSHANMGSIVVMLL